MVNNQQTVLRFSGAQELREAADAHETIINCFNHHSSIVIDLADVTEVDLTLVQLIESARISAAREGKSLSLSSPASGALLTALERGGFLGEAADPRTQFWLAA